MDTTRFQSRDTEFPVVDLVASLSAKTETSISFNLGRYSDVLELPEDGTCISVGPRGVFNVIGWLDVHHPCHGHIKTNVRVVLPNEYLEWESMRDIVHQVFSALSIPADETYEASFVSPDQQTGIEQATDREGMTDRIY